MPRKAIDYSKCLIYKLCCDDPTITDIYVGHTTDKIRRKNEHKYCCNNPNAKNHNFYVYQFIRENGGWNNWNIIIIEAYSCENNNQAEFRERYWIETLQSTLNKNIPTRSCRERYMQDQDEFCKKAKAYREEHRDEIKENKKNFYQENKEEIEKQKKQKINCECGSIINKGDKAKHIKTKKHNNYLNSLNHELI